MMPVGAYIHAKPDGTPFYVGKGDRYRMGNMHGRNNRHTNTVKKYGRLNILKKFIECSSNSIALQLEVGLIKTMRRNGFDLVNLTDGGDGVHGYKPSAEAIAKMAERNRGRVQSAEERKARSIALLGRKRGHISTEHKANISAAIKGRRWYNNGKYVVFCHEGNQPEGYVIGRGNNKMISKKMEDSKCPI
jgi:hypothetical protein